MKSLLITPHVSEKAVAQAQANIYCFEVPLSAGKIEVAREVQQRFKVKVEAVRMMTVKGKVKRFRRVLGRQRDIKKAMVKLQAGQKITLFEKA